MMLSSSLSARLFGFLVTLYPEKLRRNYGAEMAIVFGTLTAKHPNIETIVDAAHCKCAPQRRIGGLIWDE